MGNKIKSKDILLTLLYVQGSSNKINEPIIGRTRIMKMMFLFEQELLDKFDNLDAESNPEFFAYDYGPFSKDLVDDLRFFITIGYIKEEKNCMQEMSEPEREEYIYDINDDIGYGEDINAFDVDISEVSYYLTDKGKRYVEKNLIHNLSNQQKEILVQLKKKINSLPLDAILEYVYNKYPKLAERSKIKDKYLSLQ